MLSKTYEALPTHSFEREAGKHGLLKRALRSRRLLRIKLAERNIKCIYRNTPTPSPSPEHDAEFVESEEEAEPSGRCAAPSMPRSP